MAGRVRMILRTSFFFKASTAQDIARYVFPVLPGPIPKTISYFLIASRILSVLLSWEKQFFRLCDAGPTTSLFFKIKIFIFSEIKMWMILIHQSRFQSGRRLDPSKIWLMKRFSFFNITAISVEFLLILPQSYFTLNSLSIALSCCRALRRQLEPSSWVLSLNYFFHKTTLNFPRFPAALVYENKPALLLPAPGYILFGPFKTSLFNSKILTHFFVVAVEFFRYFCNVSFFCTV